VKVKTSTKSEEKPQKLFIVEGDDEKAPASNTSSFNGCLRLTIVTKFIIIIDNVHFEDINPRGGGGGNSLTLTL